MDTKTVQSANRSVRYFISYARMDKGLADSLIEPLTTQLSISRRFSFWPWRDTLLLPGEDLDDEIHQAMEDCLVGVLLGLPAFLWRPSNERDC